MILGRGAIRRSKGHGTARTGRNRRVAVPYADLHNPQTLNLYAYVGGNPTNHADAGGLATYAAGNASESGDQVEGGGCNVGANANTCAGAKAFVAAVDNRAAAAK